MSYFERVRISLFSFLKILFLLDFLLFFLNGNVLNLRSAWGEPLSTISNLMFNDSMCLPWRRKWQHIPVFLPGQSHGQRSLVGCSPKGHRLLSTHTHNREPFSYHVKCVSCWCDLSMMMLTLIRWPRGFLPCFSMCPLLFTPWFFEANH